MKRVAAIHDISGFGKCSLTVALPIISAAGIECSVMPTAVLSTHTGGFTGYTYRDLTSDIIPFARHWKSLGIEFDALYSGFLGSFEQIDLVARVFDLFKRDDNLILVDPVMADNGQFYAVYSPAMASGMARLCAKADIIVPNLTEAAFLLGEPYRPGPYEEAYIMRVAKELCALGPRQVVLTGVSFAPGEYGAVGYDSANGSLSFYAKEFVGRFFHGTGDVFASVLLSALLGGHALAAAVRFAVEFTHSCILRTHALGIDQRFGVDFESGLSDLARLLGEGCQDCQGTL